MTETSLEIIFIPNFLVTDKETLRLFVYKEKVNFLSKYEYL